MRGYPQFCFWIPIALAINLNILHKNTLVLVDIVLNLIQNDFITKVNWGNLKILPVITVP